MQTQHQIPPLSRSRVPTSGISGILLGLRRNCDSTHAGGRARSASQVRIEDENLRESPNSCVAWTPILVSVIAACMQTASAMWCKDTAQLCSDQNGHDFHDGQLFTCSKFLLSLRYGIALPTEMFKSNTGSNDHNHDGHLDAGYWTESLPSS